MDWGSSVRVIVFKPGCFRGLVLLLLATGCENGSSRAPANSPVPQSVPVQVQPAEFKLLKVTSTKVEGGQLTVRGATDLPDGSRIHITLDLADYDPKATYIGSDIDVNSAAGKFEGKIPIPARPEFRTGPYVVETMFTPKGQAQSVLDAVGVDGERLAGRPSRLPFKVMESSLKLKKLDFKVKSATIPRPDQFAAGSPERLYIDVVTAWSKRDWTTMANRSQKSWRLHESNPSELIKAQFDLFVPFGVVGQLKQEPGPLSNMKKITATLEGAIGSSVQKRRVQMNIVMESGEWGWNPTSALGHVEVP